MFREEIMRVKDPKGGISAATWFLGGEVETVIICQFTPGGKLAEQHRKVIEATKDDNRRLV